MAEEAAGLASAQPPPSAYSGSGRSARGKPRDCRAFVEGEVSALCCRETAAAATGINYSLLARVATSARGGQLSRSFSPEPVVWASGKCLIPMPSISPVAGCLAKQGSSR